jgi:K+-transporting ATPase ATPase C chain
MKLLSVLRVTVLFFLVMTIVTGIFYPLTVTGFAQLVFPLQANGSLVKIGDTIRGSTLIGQDFKNDKYFAGRPSAASYSTLPSGASNLTSTGTAMTTAVQQRRADWQKNNSSAIPGEMQYASASGLDPDISTEAALAQVERIVQARGLNDNEKAELISLIDHYAQAHAFGFLAIPRVNVLELNIILDTDPRFNK